MTKNNIMWIGIGMFAIILVALISSGSIKLPFAAIPPTQSLDPIVSETGHTYDVIVYLTSDSKSISNLWYNVEIYGPNIGEVVYDNAVWSSGWQSAGLSIDAGNQKIFPVTVPGDVLEPGKDYGILVYLGDGGQTTDSIVWKGMVRSAYDDAKYGYCLDNPDYYNCPEESAETCCHGSGYLFDVVSLNQEEYIGSVHVEN